MNPTHELQIRNAREDERAAIAALTLAAYAPYANVMTPTAWGGLDQAVRTALTADETGVERIVADNGALVGSVMLFSPTLNMYGDPRAEAQWPELRLLAVDASARGTGVGTALVLECMRRARDAGASNLGLHTSASLRNAVRLYEQLGFERAPVYDFQPEGAELVTAYRKRLS